MRQQLQDKGLVPDDWGGDTIFVDVSALTKQGVDKLIEMILLQADLLELKANPNRRAKGNVIESGPGTRRPHRHRAGAQRHAAGRATSSFAASTTAASGRLINEEGKRLKEAGPSVAVKVLGLNGVPEAGLEFSVVEDEKAARDLAETARPGSQSPGPGSRAPRSPWKTSSPSSSPAPPRCSRSSSKPIPKARSKPSSRRSRKSSRTKSRWKSSIARSARSPNPTSPWPPPPTPSSSASTPAIDSGVADKAKHEGVQIKLYAIIYELIDQVKEAMAGLLDPLLKDVTIGAAEVRKIFELSKGAPVAGCMVTSGRIVKGKVRVRRRKEIIYEGSPSRCAGSRTKSTKCAPAWNAAFASKASVSSRSGTSSSVTRSRRSLRNSERMRDATRCSLNPGRLPVPLQRFNDLHSSI